MEDSKLEERLGPSVSDGVPPASADESSLVVEQQALKQVRLHCFNVWYAEQLPWQAARALRPECNCLFSVVQSSTGVSPGHVLAQWTAQVNITAG